MSHEPDGDDHHHENPPALGEPLPLKDARLTIAAHDVRTPLTVIRGQAQLLARIVQRSELPEPQRVRLLRGLARIDTSVSELLAMLERTTGPRSPQEQEPPFEVKR